MLQLLGQYYGYRLVVGLDDYAHGPALVEIL